MQPIVSFNRPSYTQVELSRERQQRELPGAFLNPNLRTRTARGEVASSSLNAENTRQRCVLNSKNRAALANIGLGLT